MTEACGIIHNMSIVMKYEKKFEAEMEDKDSLDIVIEFYGDGVDALEDT